MQTQVFNIALPKELVEMADIVARKEYRNRSELIREALRVYLQDKEEWEELFRFGEKQRKKLRLKSEKDIEKIVSNYRRHQ